MRHDSELYPHRKLLLEALLTMSDAIIEEVSINLATTFVKFGSMQGSLPEATNAFRWLHQEVAGLRNAIHTLQESNRQRDGRIETVLSDTRNIKHQQLIDVDKLNKFTSTKDGMVSWEALRNYLDENYAQLAAVHQMQPTITSLTNNMAHKIDAMEVARQNSELRLRIEKLEHRLKSVEDVSEDRHLVVVSHIEELDTTTQELGRFNSTTRHLIETYKSDKGREVDIKLADLEGQIKLMDGVHNDNLSASVEDIVACLKKHSTSIEEINRRAAQDVKQLVTKEDLEAIAADVDALRKETDDAQFKIHEAYSKCMSIATLSGAMQEGHGAAAATAAGVLHRVPMYPGDTSSRPRTSSASPTVGGGLGRAARTASGMSMGVPPSSPQYLSPPSNANHQQQNGISFEESERILTRAANNFFHDQKGLAKTLETQVEQLRQEIRAMQNSSLPTLTQQLLNLRSALDDCVTATQRTGTNLKNWIFAFTSLSEPTLDKLISALKPPCDDRSLGGLHGMDRDAVVRSGRYGDDPELVEAVIIDFIQKSVEPLVAQVSSKLTKQLVEERNVIRNDVLEEVKRRARGHDKSYKSDSGEGASDEDEGPGGTHMAPLVDLTASRKVRNIEEEPEPFRRLDDANIRLGLEVAETFIPQSRLHDLRHGKEAPTVKPKGISVMSVAPGSVASAYNIMAGERILKLNDVPVTDVATFVTELRRSLRQQILAGTVPASITLVIQDKAGARRLVGVDIE